MLNAEYLPEPLIKHGPVLGSLAVTLSLVALNSYLFFLLLERVQDDKAHGYEGKDSLPLLAVCFAMTTAATIFKLHVTVTNSRAYRNKEGESKNKALTVGQLKALRYDSIVTTIKLGTGAFGWQFAFMLTQYYAGYKYDADFTHESAIPIITIWPATGVGAALFLNVGMLASQKCLSHVDEEAMSVSRMFFLAVQLCVSVFIADGLWLFATNSASILSFIFHQAVLRQCAEIIFAAAFYLAESFLFKVGHNALNHWHSSEYYHKFDCDNRFVGVLWCAYFGFKFAVDGITALLKLLTGWAPSQFAPKDVIVACVFAAIGTMILPAIYGRGNYVEQQRKSHQIVQNDELLEQGEGADAEQSFETVNMSNEASDDGAAGSSEDLGRSLLGSTEKKSSICEPVNFYASAACVYFKRIVDEMVQLAVDSCPRPAPK